MFRIAYFKYTKNIFILLENKVSYYFSVESKITN